MCVGEPALHKGTQLSHLLHIRMEALCCNEHSVSCKINGLAHACTCPSWNMKVAATTAHKPDQVNKAKSRDAPDHAQRSGLIATTTSMTWFLDPGMLAQLIGCLLFNK